MAGGVFNGNKNKVLPGIYIDYKTVNANTANIGSRGILALAKQMSWGPEGDIIEINDTNKLFDVIGYDISSDDMLFVREATRGTNLTQGASKILLWRLAEEGAKKSSISIGDLNVEAKYSGKRGNDISIVVSPVIGTDYKRVIPGTQLDLIPNTLSIKETEEAQVEVKTDATEYSFENKTTDNIAVEKLPSGKLKITALKEGTGTLIIKAQREGATEATVDLNITIAKQPFSTIDVNFGTSPNTTPKATPIEMTINSSDDNWSVSSSDNKTATIIKEGNKAKATFLKAGELDFTFRAHKDGEKENSCVVSATITDATDNWSVELSLKTPPQSLQSFRKALTNSQNDVVKLPKASVLTNDIKGDIQVDDYIQWTVETYIDKILKDTQTVGTFIEKGSEENIPGKIEDLKSNNWVTFSGKGFFESNVGVPLAGGTNGNITPTAHTDFLSVLGKKSFNTVIYDGDDIVLKSTYKAFVNRLCKEEGKYVNCVMANYTSADSEYIISINNGFTNEEGIALTPQQATWWVGGATAGANYNESLTYHKIPGASAVSPEYENSELTELLQKGNFLFFKLEDEILVLSDVNTFTSFTKDKSKILSKNRVVRTIMQICNDLYVGYTKQYIGKVDVNSDGVKLVKAYGIDYLQQIQSNNGIKNFNLDTDYIVKEFEIDSMTIDMFIQPVDSLEKIYISMRIA